MRNPRWLLALLFVLSGALAVPGLPIITVLDFKTEGVSESEMRTVISLLSSALFQTRRFQVIDVTERERLLRELEFSVADCTDESCQLEIGRLLSAESIVVGTMGRVGSRYVLAAKILETETARTQNTADGIYPNLDALVDDIFELAKVLAQAPSQEAVAEAGPPGPPASGTVSEEPAAVEPAGVPAGERADRPAAGKPEAPRAAERWVFVSTGLEAGPSFPVGIVAEIYETGLPIWATFYVNLRFPWGLLGFGLLSGYQHQATQDVRYPFDMRTIPVAVDVRYLTAFPGAFYLSGSLLGGVALNLIDFWDDPVYRDDLFTAKAMVSGSVGGGFLLLRRKLGVGVKASLVGIFFNDTVYLGVNPALQIEYRF